MFSIVICSVNTGYLSDVTENIGSTIGAEFELLVWDNRTAKKGLCEVYNAMAEKAQYSYICFLHEDILFTTKNWGAVLLDLFRKEPRTGVIGVAGSKYKSLMFSGWYSGQADLDCYNITHRINGRDDKLVCPLNGPVDRHKVVTVDGVFICSTRQAWQEVRFDENALRGFHFYDIDFSLRASRTFDTWVTMNIDLIHITKGGDYGDVWVKEAIAYHNGHKDLMPRYEKEVVAVQQAAKIEVRVAERWLDWLKLHKISLRCKTQWIFSQKLYRWPSLWYPMLKFILYRPLRLKYIHLKALKRIPKTS